MSKNRDVMITLPYSSVKYCLATVTCCNSLSIGVYLGGFACSGRCEKKNELKLVICKSHRTPQIFLWGKKKRTNQEWRGSEYRQPVDCIQSWQDVKLRMSEGEGLHNHNPTNPLWPATGETNYKFQLNTSKMHYFWNVFIIIKSFQIFFPFS